MILGPNIVPGALMRPNNANEIRASNNNVIYDNTSTSHNSVNSSSGQNNFSSISDILEYAKQSSSEASDRQEEFNREMWNKTAEYNANQAQLDREFQERMSNTQYQRAIKDLESAGLNKLLAYSNLQGNSPSGSVASMSPVSSTRNSDNIGSLLGSLANNARDNKTKITTTLLSSLINGAFGLVGRLVGGLMSIFKS